MNDADTGQQAPATRHDPDRPLPLHPLVYLADGEEVTVGRPDIDSYGIFPPDGAELVRRLERGDTPREAAAWYAGRYQESVDIDDVIEALGELDFLREETEPAPPPAAPVRWRRLGAAVFSTPAFVLYAALAGWALVAMARHPDLVPSYRNVFFTEYYTIVQAALFVAAVPQLLLHEAFHALAGRRLGLRSRLSVGRRLYFIVLETSLPGLVAVPRRRRYLPILAGMLADVLVIAALTVAADLGRGPDGTFPLWARFCLAFAFAVLLRIAWQFSLYLRTDLYVLVTTALGCVDLHATAKGMLANRVNRLLGRPGRLVDESAWHPVDRRVARWYSWLIVAGYAVSLTTFVLAVVPIVYRMAAGVLGRFTGGGASVPELLDSAVFTGFVAAQLAVLGWLAIRDRHRRRPAPRHVIA
ncbi:hypothetical protein Sru01_23350 [Sphaerisporangium rufum]|uniref:Uncharacterized protein n=1 Tax=Sphaerisporangium rufum TaxID=1381558 RepID=A0A919V112_9ACTN|nr:hypothetical protein [Sphaerisporangium rufum]GII77353.1 hypothetical protein Sru01_23350 [Sphaerisporangium rufum]